MILLPPPVLSSPAEVICPPHLVSLSKAIGPFQVSEALMSFETQADP